MMKKTTKKFDEDKINKVLEIIATSQTTVKSACDIIGIPKSVFYRGLLKNVLLKQKFNDLRDVFNKEKGTINDYRSKNARNTNKKRFDGKTLSIYVLGIKGTDFYKIGVSSKPNRRIRDLRSATPFEIELIFCKEYEDAYELEDKVHQKIRQHYIKSEWFSLNPSEVAEVVFMLTINLKNGKGQV